MVGLQFNGGKVEKIFSSEFNNLANVSKNAVISGLNSSYSGLDITIGSGKIFFGTDIIDVTGDTVSISSNSSGLPRTDLVLVDSTGTLSVLTGTPSITEIPADYDADLYIALYRVILNSGVTTLSSINVKDIRVFNIGGSGSGGGSFARHIEEFTAQTSVTVTHNLGDDEPLVFVYNSSGVLLEDSDITSITATDINTVDVVFSGSTTGKIIVYGGSGVNNAYYKYDFTSQTSLSIPHNLNNQAVLVQVIDTSGKDIVPDEIERADANNVNITFGSSQSGTVIIAGGVSSVGFPMSPSQGDILYFDGTNWEKLPAGTSGQLLQTNGVGANPSWSEDGISYLERQNIQIAELAVRTLQTNNTYINGPNLVVDEFLTNEGSLSTVNTSSSTSKYDSISKYYVLNYSDEAGGDATDNTYSFSNPSNAFDNDDNTYSFHQFENHTGTRQEIYLGKTFSSKFIGVVKAVFSLNITSGQVGDLVQRDVVLVTYNGSVWTDVVTLQTSLGDDTKYSIYYNLNSAVQGVAIKFVTAGGNGQVDGERKVYSLEYGDYNSSSTVICDVNTTTLDGNEKACAISIPDSILPTNTSILASISDGSISTSNYTVNPVSKGVIVPITSLGSGTLKVTFILQTTNNSVSPTLLNYGIDILR